ncbi:MAG: hypothetical protein Q7J54_06090 [Candidatus Woesearchaeota archaeon]|nr:hypothetical protein [Candidatus Woesearchaeota archaeon]
MMGGRLHFAILIVMFLDIVGLIKATFGIEGIFIWQLFLTVIFLISGISIMYLLLKEEDVWAWPYVYFSAVLVDVIYLYFLTGGSFMLFLLALFTIIGMLASLNIVKKKEAKDKDFYDAKDIVKDIELEPSESKYSVETYEPGKYVASKNASYYHAPKCDWAEKINARNRVWLNSDEEAKKKGYKKHGCLK